MAAGDIDPAEALWGYPSKDETRLWGAVAVIAALLLQWRLPEKLSVGPRVLLPALEALLLVLFGLVNQAAESPASRATRVSSIVVIAVVNAANVTSLGLLIHRLLNPGTGAQLNGRPLIYSAVSIWATGVLVFGLWYWELDRGGPGRRCRPDHAAPDFLFPQMENPAVAREKWTPHFVDYMYVSLTNATAFSPTDVLPLTRRVKVIMAAQSISSLATIAVVGARAVNILS